MPSRVLKSNGPVQYEKLGPALCKLLLVIFIIQISSKGAGSGLGVIVFGIDIAPEE